MDDAPIPTTNPIYIPNDSTDPRFWAYWDEVRQLTCPDDTPHDCLDD